MALEDVDKSSSSCNWNQACISSPTLYLPSPPRSIASSAFWTIIASSLDHSVGLVLATVAILEFHSSVCGVGRNLVASFVVEPLDGLG